MTDARNEIKLESNLLHFFDLVGCAPQADHPPHYAGAHKNIPPQLLTRAAIANTYSYEDGSLFITVAGDMQC